MTQTAAQMAKTFGENARWAGYDNDGYDRFASGRESGWRQAAKLVAAEGITEAVAARLAAEATIAEHANDFAGFDDYTPFDKGEAETKNQAAQAIRQALAA